MSCATDIAMESHPLIKLFYNLCCFMVIINSLIWMFTYSTSF